MAAPELLIRLHNAYALGRVNADNENYYAPVTLKELKAAINTLEESASEIERLREALSGLVDSVKKLPAPIGGGWGEMVAALFIAEDALSKQFPPVEAAWRDFEASTAADIQQIVEGA